MQMRYALDINDSKIKQSIDELGLEPSQFLIKAPTEFEGTPALKQLRFDHYQEKLEKSVLLVKSHITSNASYSIPKAFITSRPSISTQETSEKIKALHRHYLLIHIQEETKKRDRLSKTMEKFTRKDNLDKKLKEEIEAKKKADESKREIIEERMKVITPTLKFNARVQSISPKPSEKDHLSSRFSIRINKSVDENYIQEKLQSLSEKFDRSKELQKLALKEKTQKISYHTQKVGKLLKNLEILKDKYATDRVHQFINKLNGAVSRKEKFRSEFQEKVKKNHEKLSDKSTRIKQNQDEEVRKEAKRIQILEDKMNTTLKNMRIKTKETKIERELKLEKFKLKEEDIQEHTARLKKTEFKKKLKILNKHLEMDRRIEMMKEEKEKDNERKRDESHKTAIEKTKLRNLKLLIERTSDSKKMQDILNTFYDCPEEASKTAEIHLKDSVVD